MTDERHQKTKQANASCHKMLITDITPFTLLIDYFFSIFSVHSHPTVAWLSFA